MLLVHNIFQLKHDIILEIGKFAKSNIGFFKETSFCCCYDRHVYEKDMSLRDVFTFVL